MSQAAAAIEQYRRGFTPAVAVADFHEQVASLQRFFDEEPVAGAAGDPWQSQAQQQQQHPSVNAAGLCLPPPLLAVDEVLKFQTRVAIGRDRHRLGDEQVESQILERSLNLWVPDWPRLCAPVAQAQQQLRQALPRSSLRSLQEHFSGGWGSVLPEAPEHPPVTVLRVLVFQPFSIEPSHELVLHASQMLTELRDAIECLSTIPEVCGTGSGCLFVGDGLYDDTRTPGSSRYSEVYLEWQASRKLPDRRLFAKDMDQVTLVDLEISLGAQYLFLHEGDCRHILVFTELRQARPPPDLKFPVCLYRAALKMPLCGVCETVPAKWLTYRDKLATGSPYPWCKSCYELAHHRLDGTLLYSDFQVFPVQPRLRE